MDIVAAESNGLQPETLNVINIINNMEDFEVKDGEISTFDFAFPIGNYGRYCGKGNKGGSPIDDLDRACQVHDGCFLGFKNTSTKNKQCNQRFVKALLPIIQANSEFTKKGAYARVAAYLFTKYM
ncbi:phospholipase A2 family protein [Pseudogracilibacillus sp. SO30301A]|uniref:phospholipase A2 family protein n=1 Tax=Pseudogracilibacillus sp. SO30301A TaxID=3098291 RepID=UPI00300E236D